MATKILVIGAPSGSLSTLVPKLTALQSKQSFSFAILLGDVFSSSSSATSSEQQEQEQNSFINKLLNGEIEFPLPTYFSVGKNPLPENVRRKVVESSKSGEGGEVCSNLWFLGRKGVLNTSEGVRIVVLGGILREEADGGEGEGNIDVDKEKENEKGGDGGGDDDAGETAKPWYTISEASALKGANSADILITYEWPDYVDRNSTIPIPGGGESGTEMKLPKSKPVRDLARRLRPRYHFVVGGEEVFWEREPYKNEVFAKEWKGGSDTRGVGTTRVIALASWGNIGKVKSMYAFNLNVKDRSTETPPANATESPYAGLDDRMNNSGAGGRKRALPDAGTTNEFPGEVGANGTFFWGDRDSGRGRGVEFERRGKRARGGHRGGGGGGGHHHQNKPPPGPESCFFCLSNPTLAKHLLVSIGTDAYLTTAKGPLTTLSTNPPTLPFPGHILIIPFSHSPTLSHIDDPQSKLDTYSEMLKFRNRISDLFTSRGCGVVCWEVARGTKGVHTHWQVVPVRKEALGKVEGVFRELAIKEGYGEFVEGGEWSQGKGAKLLDELERDYFRVWISGREGNDDDDGWMVLDIKEGAYFDLQFGRRVVAEVVGGEAEKRVNWRDCGQTMDEEVRDAKAFKEAFQEWDFTL